MSDEPTPADDGGADDVDAGGAGGADGADGGDESVAREGEGGGAGDEDAPTGGDTFGVGVHVTAEELQFVVHVPVDVDSGWTDPGAFQRRIEAVTWDVLDREATLRRLSASASDGETVTLGTVTMRPDGTVVSHTLSSPATGADGDR